MLRGLPEISAAKRRRYEAAGPQSALLPLRIESLSSYLAAFYSVVRPEGEFWFRGHADFRWDLTPSALRYSSEEDRNVALSLVQEFKRIAEMKLPNPPRPDEQLKWLQLAQHYGLPTRLLDWTKNAAVALYFACQSPKRDGAVLVLNPVNLNSSAGIRKRRVLDAIHDMSIIRPYLRLTGRRSARGRRTIAISPVFNSERITLQRGCFTIHGSREFALTGEQAPGLTCLPILAESKERLLSELSGVGIDEMSLFPELEHACNQLKRDARLPREGAR